jgi:hypothetical protein
LLEARQDFKARSKQLKADVAEAVRQGS